MRYRKKPVEVEAWQVGSDKLIPDWVLFAAPKNDGTVCWHVVCDGKPISVFRIPIGKYLVRSEGNYLIVDTEEFEYTYEAVNDAED